MTRFISIAVILLLATLPLAGQSDPRFRIERIDVRNSTRSADIVRSESRLQEGQSYTERELREASYRINRLPFVFDSTYSLEKGSVRDSYVFVVTITPTRAFFYDLELDATLNPGRHGDPSGSLNAVVGARKFIGRRGVAHIAGGTVNATGNLVNDVRTIEAGYTQYDLFGTRAFATVNVAMTFRSGGETDAWPSLLIGVPITRNQTLTASLAGQNGSYGSADTPVQSHYRSRQSELAWTYNSTDHPFFPSRGVLLRVALVHQTNSQQMQFPSPGVPVYVTRDYDSRLNTVTLAGAKYWQLSDRHSAWGRVEEFLNQHHSESGDVVAFGSDELNHQERLSLGFTRNLRNPSSRTGTESWAEATYQLTHYPQPEGRLPPGVYFDNYRSRAGVSWVRRTAIGRLHLGVGYEW